MRELRRTKELSLEALAERAKLNDKFIQAIETGRQAPSIDTIEKLALGLGVTLRELLLLDEDGIEESPTGVRARARQLTEEPTEPRRQLAQGTVRKARLNDEQIQAIVREADRMPVAEVARKHGISQQTVYAWRSKLAAQTSKDARRIDRLEAENAQLKRMLADRVLVLNRKATPEDE